MKNPAQENSAQNTQNNHHSLSGGITTGCRIIQDSQDSNNICPICGERKRRSAIICGIKYSFRVLCKCEAKKRDLEQKEQENLDKMRKIEKLKKTFASW